MATVSLDVYSEKGCSTLEGMNNYGRRKYLGREFFRSRAVSQRERRMPAGSEWPYRPYFRELPATAASSSGLRAALSSLLSLCASFASITGCLCTTI